MDFSLTDDQKLIRDTVRQFMEAEVRPKTREYDKQEHFPAEEIRRLGEMGCCGMLVPEEWGGAGMDTLAYVVMLEEVARVDASIAVTLSVTNSVVTVPLWKHGTEAQKKKYLRRAAQGEILGAFCLTEPQAGSDSASLQTRAEKRGDKYFLNGTKSWVSTGGDAGVLVAFAKTDPAAGARGVTAFLIEPQFKGFRVSRYEDKMGLRSSHTAEIVFDDCEVPAENRLGEEGQGLKIALEALDGGRVGIASQAVGIAQGAMEASVKYAKQRRAFGKTISEFQAIQWMIADMQTEIEAARCLVHRAAWVRDNGGARLGPLASRAKLYASEMVNRVVYKAVQVHGSAGYSRETDVERMYRDARVISIYEGTSEIQRMIIARDLLAQSGGASGRAVAG
ncbi:MAG TPA: acyl-CoA dehydrogenase family protein [Candidatus Acidoferrales bacterium]|jgi:alkylation response protein AidB-like acyl-CoA dehydrogenase|nr:acyl-CoA dehydrogenase family protein [Candidatus Acidoferrales bacterium]